jgi:hypothetical protein
VISTWSTVFRKAKQTGSLASERDVLPFRIDYRFVQNKLLRYKINYLGTKLIYIHAVGGIEKFYCVCVCVCACVPLNMCV